MNIFVGSLPFSLEEGDLKEFFEEYGEVTSVRIITDKFTGKSKGFGFVDMPNDEEAKAAIEELDGAEVNGRTIVVNQSEERKPSTGPRKPFGEGGGSGGFNRGGSSAGSGSSNGGGYNKGGFNKGGSGGYKGGSGSGGGSGFNRGGGGGRRGE